MNDKAKKTKTNGPCFDRETYDEGRRGREMEGQWRSGRRRALRQGQGEKVII